MTNKLTFMSLCVITLISYLPTAKQMKIVSSALAFSFGRFLFPQGISGEQSPPQWQTIFAK
jgi:hypothetical protein